MEVAAALHHSSGLRTSTAAHFSNTAVEPIAPRVVGSLPPVEEFTGPVYDHVHQEQFAAGEMSENMVEIPVWLGVRVPCSLWYFFQSVFVESQDENEKTNQFCDGNCLKDAMATTCCGVALCPVRNPWCGQFAGEGP